MGRARTRRLFLTLLALSGLHGAVAAKQGHQGHSAKLRIHAEPRQQSLRGRDKNYVSTEDEHVAPNIAFKMPKSTHVDSLSAATDGFLDWFVVGYWGVLLLILLMTEMIILMNGGVPIVKRESTTSIGGLMREDTEDDKYLTLAPNFWTLNVVASRGKAFDHQGNELSPMLVFSAAISMGLLQLFTLFLIVYDIDPSASPYTEKPSTPWKTSPLTVNCMKVVMTFFQGMSVVAEAGDSYDNYIIGMGVGDLLTSRFFVLFIPLFHYFITLAVILAGVSVILSCQAVPDILYNSMAILFITQVDELFWGFFERTFDVDATWRVEKESLTAVAESELLKRGFIMLPMLWGFQLLGRAWYRQQMPMMAMRIMAKG